MSRSNVNFENDLITLFYRFSIVLTSVFLIRDTLMYPNYTGIIIELSVIATNIIILFAKDKIAIFRDKNFTFLYFILVLNLSWSVSGYSITNVLIFLVIGMGVLMLFQKPVSFLYLALTMLNFVVNFLVTELSDDLLMDIKKLLIIFPVTAAILFMDFIKSRYVAEQNQLSMALEELRHRDQILKNREKKYRLLAENSHDFIVQFNSDYSIEYISPSVSEILGYKKGQIYTSRNPLEMIHREDLPEILKVMGSKNTHLQMVFRIRRNDGQFIWLETNSTRTFDENGEMISSVVNCRDVSDRVSFEKKLQESEEKFRFIVNNSSDIVAAYDSQNNCLYMSPVVEAILGFTQQEYYDLNDPFRFALPEDLDSLKEQIKFDLNNKSINGNYVFRCVHKSGKIVWLEGRANREFNEDGELDRVVYIFRDITENKLLINELEESKSKLSSLIHHMPVGIVFHDTNFKVLLANDTAGRVLGFNITDSQDLYLNKMCRLYDENKTLLTMETHPAAIAVKTGKSVKGKVVMVINEQTQKTTWLSLNIVSMNSGDNSSDSVICTFTDITEKKKTEEKLKASERQFRLLLDHLPAGVVVKRPDTGFEIIHWNEKIAKITGHHPSKMIGKTHEDLLEVMSEATVEKIRQDDYSVIETGEPSHIYSRKINNSIVNSIQLLLEDGHSEKGLLVELYMDVTDKVKSELALKEKEQLIQRVIAHDIRSSLSSYTGLGEIVESYFESDRIEKVVEIVKALDQTSSMLTNLLDNLNNWTRLQLQDYAHNLSNITVDDAIMDAILFFQRHAELKNIKIEKEVEKHLNLVLDGNSFMVILRNLLSNAIKFSFADSVIHVNAHSDGHFVCLSVKDSGIGIPPDKLDRIFDTYDHKSSVGTKGEGGSGIGLSLIYEFVKMNNGGIKVDSEVGEGTIVTIHFPVMEPLEDQPGEAVGKWVVN